MRRYGLLEYGKYTASAAPRLTRLQVAAQARCSAAQAPTAIPGKSGVGVDGLLFTINHRLSETETTPRAACLERPRGGPGAM